MARESRASNHNNHLPVPPEILDHILDNLHVSDDTCSVIACSYAHRTLRVLCRKRLFRDVVFSVQVHPSSTLTRFSEDEMTTGRRLLDLLNKSPHIKSLTVAEVEQPLSVSPGPYSILPGRKGFPLYTIVARAASLKRFTLTFSSMFLAWSSMEPKLQTFFTRLVTHRRLPALGIIPLRQIPMSIFFNCQFLEELQISHLFMDKIITPSSKVKLKSLYLSGHRDTGITTKSDTNAKERLSWFMARNSVFDIRYLQR